ncbi:hypothetical protein [Streptomyces hesseae]|uniref:Acylphosphatase-like domain-containing protein n=1 Tax=Streptomyces hesseae TaxID=3075519 RepID=A0ABU2SKM3_9ACTN|nr:hypothetical protein [Streptomyces sp. DSM 40473]MDT0449526.1 hypothetical protein [Streptomyces sp. DSM 40473]
MAGPPLAVQALVGLLRAEAPPLADIRWVTVADLSGPPPPPGSGFAVRASARTGGSRPGAREIPSDVATCEAA